MPSLRILRASASAVALLGATGSPLDASQHLPDSLAVVSRGAGPAVVLLSGLLGGTARLEPVADRLVASGFRVVSVDPYRLAANAADVSFDGLARTVAEALRREGLEPAIIVAHAHASGIALRLAANEPDHVTDILLLDAGVVASTRSPGVERAMRVVSLVTRLPGGSAFIRSRLLSGIRANSGNPGWLTDDIAQEYADPLLAELPAVSRLVARLAAAREPEPVARLLPRIRAELTALIGAAPHATGAGAEELSLLRQHPRARVRHLEGVGHFVHEEAPLEVVAEVLAARARRATAMR